MVVMLKLKKQKQLVKVDIVNLELQTSGNASIAKHVANGDNALDWYQIITF